MQLIKMEIVLNVRKDIVLKMVNVFLLLMKLILNIQRSVEEVNKDPLEDHQEEEAIPIERNGVIGVLEIGSVTQKEVKEILKEEPKNIQEILMTILLDKEDSKDIVNSTD